MTRRAATLLYLVCIALASFGVWAVSHDHQTSDAAITRSESRYNAEHARGVEKDKRILDLKAALSAEQANTAALSEQIHQSGGTPVVTAPVTSSTSSSTTSTTQPATPTPTPTPDRPLGCKITLGLFC